jgi:hypothetical protein
MGFTQNELTIIQIYSSGDRKDTISKISLILPYIGEEEKKMRELILSVMRKLQATGDDDYLKLELVADVIFDQDADLVS